MVQFKNKNYLTLAETAQALNVSRMWIWRKRKDGVLPFVEVAGKQYVPQQYVDEQLKQL